MKQHIIFIGNKFIYNKTLKEYALRRIENESEFIASVTYFQSRDNSLFLYLEEKLHKNDKIIIICTKKNFSTIGKLICTITSDNQVLHDGMLMPHKAAIYEERTYLLEYNHAIINVMQMDEGELLPTLLLQSTQTKATIHVFNEDKETLQTILSPIAQTYEVNFTLTKQVEDWLIIDISSNRYGEISNFIQSVKKLLPNKLITSANIILHIIKKLSQNAQKISFAESCTGGLLAYYFTKENGASSVLDGSLITYSNSLKENWLAVSHETIQNHGAVSSAVVNEMSEGIVNVSSADYAISISGIAGESGGTLEKPVGTVYIGVRYKEQHIEKHLQFYGDRNYIQEQSALYAIKMLLHIDKKTFFTI